MKTKIINCILSFLLCFYTVFAYAGVKCTRPTIGFFNGMLNNRKEATDNFSALKSKLSGQDEVFTQFGMPFDYVLFYNSTEGISKDINEVFKQLKQEEENGTIALDPRTEEDYKTHQIYAADAIKKKMGLLLIGHSQGNFFLNPIYEYCTKNAGSVPCKAIHVGSPSSKIYGSYYLSNNDIIIQSFYKMTGRAFQPNVAIPYSLNDVTGHGFIKTYLDSTKPAESLIMKSIDTALYNFCPFT